MSDQGMEIYNASSVLEFGLTDRVTRSLGIATATGNTAGSVTDAGLATGDAYWRAGKVASSAFFGAEPSITVVGTLLSWTWPNGGSGTWKISYGVY